MNRNYTFAILLGILSLCILSDNYAGEKEQNKNAANNYEIMDFSDLRDTVYTLKNCFLEVNLFTQMGYLHFRDSVKSFKVSTGTKWAEDGIETNEGLYVIQSKLPKWHSVQFDSTLMINWMGFNYGIGFHALEGNSYYRHLGVKRSSHGCVRVTRDDAKFIYSQIEIGTPVLVHSGNNSVVVGIGDSIQYMKNYSYKSLKKILPVRYKYLYGGNYFLQEESFGPKIFIDDENVTHDGLPIGNSKRIPKRQITKPISNYISSVLPEHKSYMLIENKSLIQADLKLKLIKDLF